MHKYLDALNFFNVQKTCITYSFCKSTERLTIQIEIQIRSYIIRHYTPTNLSYYVLYASVYLIPGVAKAFKQISEYVKIENINWMRFKKDTYQIKIPGV